MGDLWEDFQTSIKMEKMEAYNKGYNDGKKFAVVHCEDCKWWTKQKAQPQGRCELGGFYPTGGWYCANGQREKNGNT